MLPQDDKNKIFTYDKVFDYKSNQTEIFNEIAVPLLSNLIEGQNATILAYGQTGSGKTYTVFGKDSNNINQETGLVYRSLKFLFDHIQETCNTIQYKVTISFFQIYMESIQDLLQIKGPKDQLQIREDPQTGVYIHGLTQHNAMSFQEASDIVKYGLQQRETAETLMNKTSSRSHAILQINLEQRWIEYDDSNNMQKVKRKLKRKSLLTVVDLAGSERVCKTQIDGKRLEESKTINKSLMALGNCIQILASENRKKNQFAGPFGFQNNHVPFRDCKLTRILQECLMGNSCVSICACITNSISNIYNFDDTNSTLLFASRSMNINVQVIKNEEIYVKNKHKKQKSQIDLDNLLQKKNNLSNYEIEMMQNEIRNLKHQLQCKELSQSRDPSYDNHTDLKKQGYSYNNSYLDNNRSTSQTRPQTRQSSYSRQPSQDRQRNYTPTKAALQELSGNKLSRNLMNDFITPNKFSIDMGPKSNQKNDIGDLKAPKIAPPQNIINYLQNQISKKDIQIAYLEEIVQKSGIKYGTPSNYSPQWANN